MKIQWNGLLLASVMALGIGAPAVTRAQSLRDLDAAIKDRQRHKNDWRNLGYLGGATAIYGLFRHDNRIVFAGAAGGLYSAWRYEEDRKSQNKLQRQRASVFSRGSFVRNGYRYERRSKYVKGQKYYYFQRTRRA